MVCQWVYNHSILKVQLHEISQRLLATVQTNIEQMKAAKSLIEREIFSTEARKRMEEICQLTQFEEDAQPIHENDEDVSQTVVQGREFRF